MLKPNLKFSTKESPLFSFSLIVKDSGFRGYIDVEYEGRTLSEDDGIRATKALLIKAGKTLA